MDSRVFDTKKLLKQSRNMKRDNSRNEYFLPYRPIRRKLKEDPEDYKYRRLVMAAERKRSLRRCSRELLLYSLAMAELRNEDECRITDRIDAESVCKIIYMNLFVSCVDIPEP